MTRAWGYAALAWLCGANGVAQTGYAGSYVATPAVIDADVTTWGVDCGVRPKSYTAADRPTVEVRDLGAHLAIIFPDHTLRTNACWSPNPTVKLTSATAADNRWRAECRTAQGEAKRELGRYTVTASSPSKLDLLEESEYDWQLKESHCRAKVRIAQTLERALTGEPAQRNEAKVPAPDCVSGPVMRVRLRPSEARVEPGERVCFSVRGFDAESCASDVDARTLRWELEKPSAARAALKDGCFKAADLAADAEGVFRVIAAGEGLRAQAEVTVAAPDLSDITARRENTGPNAVSESEDGPSGKISDTGVKALRVERRVSTLSLALGGAGLVLLVGTLGWVVARRKKPALARLQASSTSRSPVRTTEPSQPERGSAPEALSEPRVSSELASPRPAVMPGALAPAEQWICPTCRRGYPPGAVRCSSDGSEPMPYSEFVRQAKELEAKPAICPSCGAHVAGGAAFCGSCGKRVSA